MIDQLDGAGCQPLPEEDYPTSRMADLPRGKRVNLRVNGTNKEDPNSSTVAYWQVSSSIAAAASARLPASPPMCVQTFAGYVGWQFPKEDEMVKYKRVSWRAVYAMPTHGSFLALHFAILFLVALHLCGTYACMYGCRFPIAARQA